MNEDSELVTTYGVLYVPIITPAWDFIARQVHRVPLVAWFDRREDQRHQARQARQASIREWRDSGPQDAPGPQDVLQ